MNVLTTSSLGNVAVFDLRFGEVEGIVQALHEVPPGDRATGSRFRYFQRLRFPEGANTGRGVPVLYGLDQLLQTLVAFELAEAGLGPTRIVRTILTNWPRLRRALRLGWLAATGDLPWSEREILVMEPAGLVDASRPEDAFVPVDDPLIPLPAFAIAGWSDGRDGPPRLILVDPGRIISALRAVLPVATGLTSADLDEAFQDYAAYPQERKVG